MEEVGQGTRMGRGEDYRPAVMKRLPRPED